MANDLGVPQLAAGQASPEVTTNDATARVGNALSDDFTVDLSAGNVTLTSTQYRTAMRFNCSGVATSGRTVTFPAVKRTAIVCSASANSNTISLIKGSTTVVVVPGAVCLVHTDGTANGLDVTVIGSLDGAPYDVGFFVPGTLGATQLMLQYIFDRRVTFLANLAGSKHKNGTNPTATATVTFKKNGSLIGGTSTASISTGGVATFTVDAVTFDAGDVLTVFGQLAPDATYADISFTLKGART